METAAKSWSESGAAKETRKSLRWVPWVGRLMSALPILALVMSAAMKLSHSPQVVELFVNKFGFDESALFPIGVLELICVLLYAIPKTSVLGAILVTGYLGGAIVTHLRVADPFVSPLFLGLLVWGGLFLRDRKLREFLLVRRTLRAATN